MEEAPADFFCVSLLLQSDVCGQIYRCRDLSHSPFSFLFFARRGGMQQSWSPPSVRACVRIDGHAGLGKVSQPPPPPEIEPHPEGGNHGRERERGEREEQVML